MTVAEGVRLPVSRHFYYSTFGVQNRHEDVVRSGSYVYGKTPGSGFFARGSDSHSYRVFVNSERNRTKQNFLTLLFRKEPNFDREIALVEKKFNSVDDDETRRILSSYQNVLLLAREEELLQRVVRAIKDKMEGSYNNMLMSIMSHYKSSIATLEHDARSAQINITKEITEEKLAGWEKVTTAFRRLSESRRIWSVFSDDGTQAYKQVFFDTGIFDYIQSPYDSLILRDHTGVHYYLYPIGLIAARSSVDFDLYQWKDVSIQFSVVDISTLAVRPHFNDHHTSLKHRHHNDALSTLYGVSRTHVVGEICFDLGDKTLRFFVNHTGSAEDFVNTLNGFVS